LQEDKQKCFSLPLRRRYVLIFANKTSLLKRFLKQEKFATILAGGAAAVCGPIAPALPRQFLLDGDVSLLQPPSTVYWTRFSV
jgi:hypothetical protein